MPLAIWSGWAESTNRASGQPMKIGGEYEVCHGDIAADEIFWFVRGIHRHPR